MIHTENPERLLTILKDYQEVSMEVEEEAAPAEEMDTGILTHDKMTSTQQDTVYELMDDLECSQEMAVLALVELGDSQSFGKGHTSNSHLMVEEHHLYCASFFYQSLSHDDFP